MDIPEILHLFSVLLLYIFATACRCDGELIKETNYFFGEGYREINPTGKKFKIGTWSWSGKDQFIGEENDVYRCERLPNEEYEERFEFSVIDIWGKTPSEPPFIYIAKEVWSCTCNTQKNINFLRIVNEVIFKEQISRLTFEDGTEVTTRNYESPYISSIRVRENKYFINTEFEKKHTNRIFKKLAGSLVLDEYNEYLYPFPNTKERLYDQSRTPKVFSKDEIHRLSISGEGRTLRIGVSGITKNEGSGKKDEADKGQGKLICRLAADVSHYSQIFLPSIEQLVQGDELFAKLKEEDFFKRFIIIKREIYLCTPKEPDASLAILQVVNDVIGTKAIRDLFYSTKIVSISSINLPEKKVTARFKEIKYLNIGDEVWSEEFYTRNDVQVIDEKYYHSTLTKDYSKDIEYLLTPMSVFGTFITNEGYDLKIGETYTHQIGNEKTHVICSRKIKVKYVNDFRTVVKVKLNDLVLHSLAPIQNDLIYKVLSQEVLLCTDESAPTIKFLRIVNEIQFTVPVHKIDTYDGVDIVGDVVGRYSEGLGIIERKYLDYKTHKPVKYVGKITFAEERAENPRKFPIIRKTIDDATCLFGYTAKILPSLTDVNARSCRRRRKNLEMKLAVRYMGLIFMEPEFDPKECDDLEKVIHSDDTALCEKVRDSHNAIIPNFLISRENEGQETVTAKTLDEYFTTEKIDVFKCTNQHKESKQVGEFLRVVTSKKLIQSWKFGNISNYQEGSIRLELVEENDKWCIKYEDVRYLDVDKRSILTPFTGYITFPDNKPGALKSGTESVVLDNNLFRQHIGRGRIRNKKDIHYTSYINEDGFNYELGSKWQIKISSEEMNCHLTEGNAKSTIKNKAFSTRFVRNNKELEADEFSEYIQSWRQEVWDCIDESGKQIMLRVVNRFQFKLEEMNQIQEIHYYDGLSIILGKTEEKLYLEITEVKYLMPTSTGSKTCQDMSNCKVVKYEGELHLPEPPTNKNWLTIEPSKLRQIARRDFHHTLQENELLRKVLNVFGDILEIGQTFYEQVPNVLERITCEKQPYQPGDEELRPKIVIYKNKEKRFFPKAMNGTEFSEYFDLTTEVWTCTRQQLKTMYRVRNILKQKNSIKGELTNTISRVYHRDGITVIPGEEVTIEEIKYVSRRGADYKIMKFDGFTTLSDKKQIPPEFKHGLLLVNEMNNYYLDDITQVAGPYGCGLDDCEPSDSTGGFIYEVGSPWTTELEVTDKVLICEEDLSASRLNSEISVQVSISLDEDKKAWSELHDASDPSYEGISQQVWICKRNDLMIYRVRNSIIVTERLARIYHTDGVLVNWLELPDTSRYVQIVEDKLFDPEAKEVYKYDGELRFQTQSGPTIRQRFFPLDYKKQLLEPRSTTDTNHYMSMDDAVILFKIAGTGPLRKEEVKRSKLQFMYVHKNGTRTLRVGANGEEVYSPSRLVSCTLHTWNLDIRTKYIPKLVEYYYDSLYELDEETFHFFFNIIEQNVWLCASYMETRAVFRIVTKFELRLKHRIVGGIKVIALHGSVVPRLKEKSKELDYLEETVYIDARTDKHLEYAGKWRNVEIGNFIGYHPNGLEGKGRTFGSGKHPIKKIPPPL